MYPENPLSATAHSDTTSVSYAGFEKIDLYCHLFIDVSFLEKFFFFHRNLELPGEYRLKEAIIYGTRRSLVYSDCWWSIRANDGTT